MDDKSEKKDRDNKKNIYDRPECFQAWVDPLGYHMADLCQYLPENRK